jgi:hypothetical protein
VDDIAQISSTMQWHFTSLPPGAYPVSQPASSVWTAVAVATYARYDEAQRQHRLARGFNALVTAVNMHAETRRNVDMLGFSRRKLWRGCPA